MTSPLERRFALEAERMIGTRFHHQGRLPGIGLDCVGLVWCAAKHAGVSVDWERGDEAGYSRLRDHALFIRALRRRFDELGPDATIGPGKILALWKRKRGHVSHCGIVDLSGEAMIHADSTAGVIRSSLRGVWGERVVTVFGVR